jgi:hypothetical protein
MSLSGDKGVAQFKKSVKMEHPSTKVTYFSHITRSNTKFEQISEYWPSTNFKISTSANISISTKLKIQDIDQTRVQNLDQDSTSLP